MGTGCHHEGNGTQTKELGFIGQLEGNQRQREGCNHICLGRKETITGMLEDGVQGTDRKEPT